MRAGTEAKGKRAAKAPPGSRGPSLLPSLRPVLLPVLGLGLFLLGLLPVGRRSPLGGPSGRGGGAHGRLLAAPPRAPSPGHRGGGGGGGRFGNGYGNPRSLGPTAGTRVAGGGLRPAKVPAPPLVLRTPWRS